MSKPAPAESSDRWKVAKTEPSAKWSPDKPKAKWSPHRPRSSHPEASSSSGAHVVHREPSPERPQVLPDGWPPSPADSDFEEAEEEHEVDSADIDESEFDYHSDDVFVCSSQRLAAGSAASNCQHERSFRHADIVGALTKSTGCYALPLSHAILSSLFGSYQHTPAMQCIPVVHTDHRELEPHLPNLAASPMSVPLGVVCDLDECVRAPQVAAAVTKLLQRAEMKDPRAVQAVKDEGEALLDAGTWSNKADWRTHAPW